MNLSLPLTTVALLFFQTTQFYSKANGKKGEENGLSEVLQDSVRGELLLRIRQRQNEDKHQVKDMPKDSLTASNILFGLPRKRTNNDKTFQKHLKKRVLEFPRKSINEDKQRQGVEHLKNKKTMRKLRDLHSLSSKIDSRTRLNRKRRDINEPEIRNSSGGASARRSPGRVWSVCSRERSCLGKCKNPPASSVSHQLSCYCDMDCVRYSDCCADYHFFCLSNLTGNFSFYNIQRNSNNDSSVNNQGAEVDGFRDTSTHPLKCFKWPSDEVNNEGAIGLWMIHQCPASFRDNEIKAMCSRLSDFAVVKSLQTLMDSRPVHYNGVVYRNRFCAECHGYHQNVVDPFNFALDCDSKPPYTITSDEVIQFMLSYCKIDWKIPDKTERRYCFQTKSTCPSNDRGCDATRCEGGVPGIVHWNNDNYRDIFCVGHKIRPSVNCGPLYKRINIYNTPLKPFSIIFNFREKAQETEIRYEEKCPEGEVLDPYMDVCSGDFRHQPPEESASESYRILLWLRPVHTNDRDQSSASSKLEKSLIETFGEAWSFTNVEDLELVEKPRQYKGHFDAVLVDDKRRGGGAGYISLDRVLNFTSEFNMTINGAVYVVFNALKRITSCPNLLKFNQSEYKMLSSPRGVVYINTTGEVLHPKDYYTNATVWKPTTGAPGTIYVCRRRQVWQTRLANCSGVFISRQEFMHLPNQSIYVNVSKKTYDLQEYFIENGTAYVCTKVTSSREGLKNRKGNLVLATLTLVCMVLSIVALVFFLVTYFLFRQLRTTPGVNLMNLALSILLAQVTWLAGINQTDQPITCTVVAALIQFFYLVSFMWTSIIAFDTWRAFSSKTHFRGSELNARRRKRILQHIAVGWIPITVHVGICISLDQSETVLIGYGSRNACWISNGMATVYTFAIPIAIALIWNATFYVMTVKAIKEITGQARMAAENSQTRRHFAIYVRLAAVMGFTWVFGFLAELLWTPLWYVFISLNCLQGAYLAGSFALSEQARKLYRGLMGGNNLASSTQDRSTTVQGSFTQSVSMESRIDKDGIQADTAI
ncbi:uncharacterized protein LOC5496844 [Nematostella vectensis]|nr:uncharacterized protein LOC5496844 [Nematostella vectensis]